MHVAMNNNVLSNLEDLRNQLKLEKKKYIDSAICAIYQKESVRIFVLVNDALHFVLIFFAVASINLQY